MRHVAIALCLAGCLLPLQARAEIAIGTNLTVLFDFDGTYSSASVQEMQHEVDRLLQRTGVNLDLRLRSEAKQHEDFEDLVLVRFHGSCKMTNMAPLLDERGPLAWSHTVEGAILPFGEVSCDKIRRAVESALWGGQKAQKDQLFGRALGRVVAHELYHIIASTHKHGKKGIAQASLSPQELIADRLDIEPEDVQRIQTRLRYASARPVSSPSVEPISVETTGR